MHWLLGPCPVPHCTESFSCPLSMASSSALRRVVAVGGGEDPLQPTFQKSAVSHTEVQTLRRKADSRPEARFPRSALFKLVFPFLFTQACVTKHFISVQMECQVKLFGGGILFCREKKKMIQDCSFNFFIFTLYFLVQQLNQKTNCSYSPCIEGEYRCNQNHIILI